MISLKNIVTNHIRHQSQNVVIAKGDAKLRRDKRCNGYDEATH